MTSRIAVQIVYALPMRQSVLTVHLPDGSTVADAIARSGILRLYPELGQEGADIAVWGRRADHTQVLRDADRIEVLRPLQADPKLARRERARRKNSTA